MRAGTTCYLGVNVPGALFSLGDGHARQGEGETCGVAVECAMDTVVVRRARQGRRHPVAAAGERHARDVDRLGAPARGRVPDRPADLVEWVAADHGLSCLDAYQLVTQAVESPLANVCDTNYTSVAKIRKQWLPDRRGPLVDVHARLREVGREYLAAR